MIDEELVRAAALEILDGVKVRCVYVVTAEGLVNLESAVLAVLTAVAPAIRAAERERCARVADELPWCLPMHADAAANRVSDDAACEVQLQIADAIRALGDAVPAAREGGQ